MNHLSFVLFLLSFGAACGAVVVVGTLAQPAGDPGDVWAGLALLGTSSAGAAAAHRQRARAAVVGER